MGSRPTGNPSIPTIDLSPFLSPNASPEARQKSADDLAYACERFGFAYIIGHGFSHDLLNQGFAMSKRLFALPLEDKMKAPHPPGYVPHRGYSYPGLEQVYAKKKMEDEGKTEEEVRKGVEEAAATTQELKESYEIGSESNPPQTNIWLPSPILPSFKPFMLSFYWSLSATSRTILRAMAEGLHLPDTEIQKLFSWHSGHNNQLRLLKYPSLSESEVHGGKVARMSAHTDWSLFTLLWQEGEGGLELEDPMEKGRWLGATPMEGGLVVNVGEMWQRASNGRYKSANHSVNLPPLEHGEGGERRTRERYSIPYFVAPDNDAVVEVFESLIDEEHPKMYEPVRFDQYGAWVAEHYYKKENT